MNKMFNSSSQNVPKYGTAANLPRHNCPPKLTGWMRSALVSAAAERPMVTLDELQKSTARVAKSVHATTMSICTPQIRPCARVARRKSVLKERHKKSCLPCLRHHKFGIRCFGQRRPKWTFLGHKYKALCATKLKLQITLNTPSPLWNMVVATCCGIAFLQQGLGEIVGQSWWEGGWS